MKPSEQQIQNAIARVSAIVTETNNTADVMYFSFHKQRYLRMLRSIVSRVDEGAVVLNIGSHYLHTSLLFKFLGYEIHSMDVQEFWDLEFVQERVKRYELCKIIENDLESFKSHESVTDKYDAVLFAEILEHITFNPISFWERIYSAIRSSGLIYISTPNSLNLYNIARTAGRILTFRGIGLPIGSIFNNVTYGHHWKEYSVSEIKKYFSLLSDDFLVSTSYYHFRQSAFKGFYPTLMSLFSFAGNFLYFFSDEVEAIIEVRKTGNWKIKRPEY